jgi:hypothetical protein
MPSLDQDQASKQNSDAILRRVERDSETAGTSSLARIANQLNAHFDGADAPDNDPIERWGRRIGRTLSLVFVVLLSWLLGKQLGWW